MRLIRYQIAFDNWIDNLVEFQETQLPNISSNMSVADALYRLEASREIPNVKLSKFDGNPLQYVDFVESFRIHIHSKPHLSDDMRMVQLRMHVCGDAQRAIAGLGSGGVMYATALKMLKDQFGQKSIIARAHINKLTKGSNLSSNDRQGLRDLSPDIVSCLGTLHRLAYFADANSTDNLRQVIKRLPERIIGKWKVTVTGIREKGETPNRNHISTFIRKHVKADFDPDFGDIEVSRQPAWNGKNKDRGRGVHSAQPQPNQGKKPIKCYSWDGNHRLSDCPSFIVSSVSARIELAKNDRLCFSCLVRGHMIKDCRSRRKCEKDGCSRFHHRLLHTDPPSASGATSSLDNDGILPVVRVQFRSQNGRVREGNVLVDSGAATTIIRKEFAKSLGLQGRREGLELSVVGGERLVQRDSKRVKFWLSPISGKGEFEVEAHEISKTVLSVPALDRTWLSSFPHLSDVQFSHKAGPIDLILGAQYSHFHAEEDVRQRQPFEPVGKKTKLGWFVIGGDNSPKTSPVCSVNFVTKVDIGKFYDLETLGVRAPDCSCPSSVVSPDDKRALDIFSSSCHKLDDRYVIGLPWKKDKQLLPDNYWLAEKRLHSLERSLLRNPERAQMYQKGLDEYLKNEWAVPVLEEELSSKKTPVHYLPHHGIYRPDKPSTPLRIVFDPASSYGGTSLNSFLLKGPCLIGDLLGVLLRFREEREAFVGDISKMFLQVRLTEEDSHVHRFLWRNLETTKKPMVYRLARVTFGDKPSPDMAGYVMLKIAEEHKHSHPDAASIIQRDRYVDDIIHSCPSAAEATKRMADLDDILASGSFRIKKWFRNGNTMSNTDHTDVSFGDQDRVKTLGVCWNPTSDTIYFQVKDVDLLRFTKRTVLSKLSMLYDPLGLAAALTIRARIAMQSIWRLKDLDWDDVLPVEICDVWHCLFQDMKELENIEFPRCLKPENATGSPELHLFADASAVAYGAAAYLLWPTRDGNSVRLVSAKARVAPLHQVTIPRLELMAALVSSRLAKTIYDELREKPSVVLWTDSQIILY